MNEMVFKTDRPSSTINLFRHIRISHTKDSIIINKFIFDMDEYMELEVSSDQSNVKI